MEIREYDDVWEPIDAVVVREDDPREITIQLRASFHGINADYDSGSRLTLNRCDLRGWEKHGR
ncbi:MAG: hypothetical protein A2Z21_10540 [Candidatus Fraserbacteria bacterium RBG_16_55_9]|uniref:Uncharacterized protein n=1 Tax=Fraserbacteria sp. (strain RBG_16_55_9) TaxID=1817864 RepID=A0A1F5UPQ1_FRAXR|nr:MAG: hypothetical protein A2Z21_10540 [Candidatus Fraserbacteria bacterium RBG_16_55_9]